MNTIYKIDMEENTQIHINSIKNKNFNFSIAVYDKDAEEYLPSVKMFTREFNTVEDVMAWVEKNLPTLPKTFENGTTFLSAEGERFTICGSGEGEENFLLVIDPKCPTVICNMTKEQVKHQAWVEQQNLLYRLRIQLDTAKIKEQEEEEERERQNLDGFTDGMTPLARGKVVDFLNRRVRRGGEAFTRKTLIKWYINEGATVNDIGDGKRILTDGHSYIAQKDWIGKIGMDYAEYLLAKDK